MTEFLQNHRDLIRNHFREHVLYKLSHIIHDVFFTSHSTLLLTPEQLFYDTATALDYILTHHSEDSTEYCKSLWTDTLYIYKKQWATMQSDEEIKAAIAMRLYMVICGLSCVKDYYYQASLPRILYDRVHLLYGNMVCKEMESIITKGIPSCETELVDWMAEYFNSPLRLSKEIEDAIHPKKAKPHKNKPSKDIFYTLDYDYPDGPHKVKRINRLMQLWQTWEWITNPQSADDFVDLFSGKNKYCNLKWIGRPTAVLTELMKQLLIQDYIKKKKGCSASSIVRTQFNMNPSGNKERIDDENKKRIIISLQILDPTKSLYYRTPDQDTDDMHEATWQSSCMEGLHITKDINRVHY
ncbi:MAG: hypothetical protein K6E86_07925 [Bacteroidales bacterium]|nr:hypothetical protein [Bacteroidales bacterium]